MNAEQAKCYMEMYYGACTKAEQALYDYAESIESRIETIERRLAGAAEILPRLDTLQDRLLGRDKKKPTVTFNLELTEAEVDVIYRLVDQRLGGPSFVMHPEDNAAFIQVRDMIRTIWGWTLDPTAPANPDADSPAGPANEKGGDS